MDVTPLLLGLDQAGFVKGRQAPDGTRKIINLIRFAEVMKKTYVFLALDSEKAFDRVHLGYLSQTVKIWAF